MAFRRNFAASVSNSANVKAVCAKLDIDQAARNELDFWLPLTHKMKLKKKYKTASELGLSLN